MRGDDLVARIGGDEFAVITAAASDHPTLLNIANRLIAAICAPYTISNQTIVIGASIGIAVVHEQIGGAADIMRHADMALYRAKNEGRNRACIYDNAMDYRPAQAQDGRKRPARGDRATTSCGSPISRSSTTAARP